MTFPPGARPIPDPEAEMERLAAARNVTPPWDTPRTLAVIRNVRCGVGDRDAASLRFTTFITEGSCAEQSLPWEDAKAVIEAYRVSDVRDLEGKPCRVDTSDRGLIRWIGPARI